MSLSTDSFAYSLLAGIALKSTAVLSAAWLLNICLRGKSAAARHLVWTAACAALLALPFLVIALPSVRVPVTAAFVPAVAQFTAVAIGSGAGTVIRPTSTGPGVIHAARSRPRSGDGMFVLITLWAAGAMAVFGQMLVGSIALCKLRRHARRLSIPEFSSLTSALGVEHHVELLESSGGSMPLTFGLLRPAVLLPSDAVEWSTERRLVVLTHELAHVRRGDVAAQLLARIALSLHWWNPLSWIAWREFLKERERAADDLVLSTGARASAYADHLLAIARVMRVPSVIGSSALAMARPSALEDRLLAILDSTVNRNSPGRAFTFAATLLAIGLAAPIAALRGQDAASQAIPADVDASIRAATSQKNFAMLDSAAEAAESARKYEIARKLLDASVSLRLDAYGPQSQEYAAGLLKLAKLEGKRGKAGEPEKMYARAASVLGERPEAATALIYQGIYALAKNPDAALGYFEHAKVVGPRNAGPATMWIAVARQRQGMAAEAEKSYLDALALEAANSPDATTTMELYADFLYQQGREDEAKTMRERAATLRKAQGTPSKSGARANVYNMGTGIVSPKLLSKVEPEYTEEARAAKYQGQAVLSVEIEPDGLAHNIHIVRGLGLGLNDKAIEALSQWRFQPGVKDGQPVTVLATIEINWRLL